MNFKLPFEDPDSNEVIFCPADLLVSNYRRVDDSYHEVVIDAKLHAKFSKESSLERFMLTGGPNISLVKAILAFDRTDPDEEMESDLEKACKTLVPLKDICQIQFFLCSSKRHEPHTDKEVKRLDARLEEWKFKLILGLERAFSASRAKSAAAKEEQRARECVSGRDNGHKPLGSGRPA